ncbi:MAG: hypothetical protein ACKV0T_10700 [Planctomycetales bacterium]
MSAFLKLESWLVTVRFVETGTHLGISVRAALELGYREVYSIDISDEFFGTARRAFQDDRRVRLLHGSSPKLLPQVMAPDVPTTFWLDAHYSGTTLPSHDPTFGQFRRHSAVLHAAVNLSGHDRRAFELGLSLLSASVGPLSRIIHDDTPTRSASAEVRPIFHRLRFGLVFNVVLATRPTA